MIINRVLRGLIKPQRGLRQEGHFLHICLVCVQKHFPL